MLYSKSTTQDFILTINNIYKQYIKKPIIVTITRPLRTSISPNLNIEYVSLFIQR